MQRTDKLDSILPGAAHADDRDARITLQQACHALAQQHLIVDDHYTHLSRHHRCSSFYHLNHGCLPSVCIPRPHHRP